MNVLIQDWQQSKLSTSEYFYKAVSNFLYYVLPSQSHLHLSYTRTEDNDT